MKIADDENSLTTSELRVLKQVARAWQFSRWAVVILISLGASAVWALDLYDRVKEILK